VWGSVEAEKEVSVRGGGVSLIIGVLVIIILVIILLRLL
jgi:hypothetical protein